LKYPNNIALCQELLRKQDKEIVRQGKENAKQNQEILHLHTLLLELSEEMAKLKINRAAFRLAKIPLTPINHPLLIISFAKM
jgi:hypothetical protein